MFNRLFRRPSSDSLVVSTTGIAHENNFSGREYHIVRSADEILSEEKCAAKVRRVKRLISATEEVWQKHYLSTIKQFVELVQGAPASEAHHHSYHGGLVEHTLEVLAAGVQIAQGYMLPPNVEPEMLLQSVDRWRFGAFVAILAHDLGKIATDIEFVYRERGGAFVKWHPWTGSMPIGAEYVYRYKPRLANSAIGKTLHEKASISLVPCLLTKEAILWIYSDVELVGQFLNTITASSAGGGAIAEIVRKADKSSVANSMGAHYTAEDSRPSGLTLHEKALVVLRKLIDDGDLRRNRPGAAVWTTETHTWVVSRVGVEAIKSRLQTEGHKGIPNNPVRMFEHFQAQGITISPENGDNTWRAEVNDFGRDWKQILTFMCFENGTIWPTRTPEIFDGTITPVDDQDKPIIGPAELARVEEVNSSQAGGDSQVVIPIDSEISTHIIKHSSTSIVATNGGDNPKLAQPESGVSAKKDPDVFETNRIIVSEKEAKPIATTQGTYKKDGKPNISEAELRKHPFFNWLLEGISHRSIKVNEPQAMVHIVGDSVALVTPAIFHKFFESAVQKKRFEMKGQGKPIFTLLQKEVFAFGVAKIGEKGQKIWSLTVTGGRKKGAMSAILIQREYFPSLGNLSPNKAVNLSEE